MRNVLLAGVAAMAMVGVTNTAVAQNIVTYDPERFDPDITTGATSDDVEVRFDGNGADTNAYVATEELKSQLGLNGLATRAEVDELRVQIDGLEPQDCTLCDVTKKVNPNNYDVVNITGQMTAGGSVKIDSTAALSESDDGSLTIETNALASTQANSWSVDANKLDHLGTGGGSSGADSAAVRGAYEETLSAAINVSAVAGAGNADYAKRGDFAADKASNYSNTNAGQEIPTFRNSMTALNLAQSSTAFGNVNVAQDLTETGKGNLSITTNALAGVQANSISVLDD
jgi:hypothetical protein